MFRLRGIGAFDVAKRRICFHDTGLHKVVQTEQVLVVAEAVEVPPAERQSAEVLGNGGEEGFCGGDAESDVGGILAHGVMGCFHLHKGVLAGSSGRREELWEGENGNAHHL